MNGRVSIYVREGETAFLNVDLDVYSRAPLDRLVAACGRKVSVHYVGKEGGRYSAHLSLAHSFNKSADVLIREFARLLARLPKRAQDGWKRAQSREFNIGIQAGYQPYSHELRLRPKSLEAAARLGARIVITTYAPPRKREIRRARRK
jgi:hypothetical protein